jgi:hypothetical protein
MTLDSRNIIGAGLALAIVGLAAWGSSVLLNPPTRVGTVEVRPLSFAVDESNTPVSVETKK